MTLDIVIGVIAVVMTFILLKKNVNLGIVLLIDSIFVAVVSKMEIGQVGSSLIKGVFSEKTLGIILILALVMVMENIMRNKGMIKQIADNLKEIVKNNVLSSAILPIFLGLLPSPGGARFSCPMVQEILKDDAKDEDKAFINYWFRHVWRDGFILYPGAIIASQLLNIPTLKFFLYVLPFTILHTVLGLIIVYPKIEKSEIVYVKKRKEKILGLLTGISPILLIIVMYIILLQFKGVSQYSLYISGIITVIFLLVYHKYSFKEFKRTAKESVHMNSVLLVLGVMVFMQFLTDSGLVTVWVAEITRYGIPKQILFVLLPFATGALSGITVSFVSLSFPILINMGVAHNMWVVIACYMAGFAGVMITPVHLCSVMSSDYFGVKIGKMLKKVIFAECFIMAAVVLLIVFAR